MGVTCLNENKIRATDFASATFVHELRYYEHGGAQNLLVLLLTVIQVAPFGYLK
jgi:hypothetical protein